MTQHAMSMPARRHFRVLYIIILYMCSSDQAKGYSHTHWQWAKLSLEKLIITNEVHTTAVTIVILIHTLNHPIRFMQGNNSVNDSKQTLGQTHINALTVQLTSVWCYTCFTMPWDPASSLFSRLPVPIPL